MTTKILIAHAPGESEIAEQLAAPLRAAGYQVAHQGTVMVGESVLEDASRLLAQGGPVVICGTVKGMGTGWAWRLVTAARAFGWAMRIFPVQIDREAYLEPLALDGRVAEYWRDPVRAIEELLTAISHYFPLSGGHRTAASTAGVEQAYFSLALKTWDIIDLANLPVEERHLASRELALRRLYVRLRVWVELDANAGDVETDFDELEERRRLRTLQWQDSKLKHKKPLPLGERLMAARRVVVLGDPGAGKSTLTRWIATANLLRLQNDDEWRALPDIDTLAEVWVPLLVRCRDLPPAVLAGPIGGAIRHSLLKMEVSEELVLDMARFLETRLRESAAILMIDGLDEIADSAARAGFCRQIEQFHLANPRAVMLVTSRIVGYREMGQRLGRGFEHLTLADLSPQDKDAFVHRWCALTEVAARRESAAEELIHDIHSTDRIERLTGNPMLLTTMALVKRKIGRLPSRRVELYEEAFKVLMNWRREVDAPIDLKEATPQLEYLAYAMCDQGAQQLREDEVLQLLSAMRSDFPNVHAVHQHSPAEFLGRLEARTGLIIEAGRRRHDGRLVPVYEFRHLTFQEYLAGMALITGRFPGRDREKQLPDLIAPLAGRTSGTAGTHSGALEGWREPVRLCVASCKDDDVEKVLRAVAKSPPGEDKREVCRARAVLAALCLADEPNVSDAFGSQLLFQFATYCRPNADLDRQVAIELRSTRWSHLLRSALLKEFARRRGLDREGIARLRSLAFVPCDPDEPVDIVETGGDALGGVLDFATGHGPRSVTERTCRLLFWMLDYSHAHAHAAAWALARVRDLTRRRIREIVRRLQQDTLESEVRRWLVLGLGFRQFTPAATVIMSCLDSRDLLVRSAAVEALGQMRERRALPRILSMLGETDVFTRHVAYDALGSIGDTSAVQPLLARLPGEDAFELRYLLRALAAFGDTRISLPVTKLLREGRQCSGLAGKALARVGAEDLLRELLDSEHAASRMEAVGGLALSLSDRERRLVSRDLDGTEPWWDPREPITSARSRWAADQLGIGLEEITVIYKKLQRPLRLSLEL